MCFSLLCLWYQWVEKQILHEVDGPVKIKQKIKSLEARTQYYKGEINKMKVNLRKFNSRIKENKSKLLLQTDLPHLVSTEISKGAVIKISTRNTIFFPVVI